MPQVLNGVGTWYWGKTNIRTSRGTCQFCRKSGQLRSYDTTKFFVVLFVPIISLGQKRIINECPFCKRHLVLSLKKFQELRDKEVGGAIEDFRSGSWSADKAEIVMSKAIGCEAQEQFLEVAPEIEKSLARDARIQARLGATYAFFGMSAPAEAAYERAYALSHDPEVGDQLALLYMRDGRPDEAAPLLQHITVQQQRDNVGFAYLLAEAYQAAGRHEEALAVLNRMTQAFPGIENEAEFQKYRTSSLKSRESARPVKSVNLVPLAQRAAEHRPLAVMLPRLIAPVLVLVGLCIYMGVAIEKGHSRTVWLVNGLDRDYDVNVDGQQYHLGALAAESLQLPEGNVTVTSADPSVPLSPQTCRIETPLLSRPYLNRTFVINPDHTALVYRQTMTYSQAPKSLSLGAAPHTLYAGQLLYSFDDIDYPFDEFPDSIKVDNNAEVTKSKIAVFSEGHSADRMTLVQDDLGRDALGIYARDMAICNPTDSQYMQIASALLPAQEALNFLRPRLDARPIQIESHRAYQELIARTEPNQDLSKEYRARLDADPTNTSLMYLLGRITPDRDEASKLFEESAKGTPPCAYGDFALAYDALSLGQFERSLELCKKALAIEPANSTFQSGQSDALLALGRYDDLLKIVRESAKETGDAQSVIAETRLLTLKGEFDAARQLVSDFAAAHPGEGDANTVQHLQSAAQAIIKYAQGDIDGFAAALAQTGDDEETKFQIAITTGNLDEALTVESNKKLPAVEDHLLLGILAIELKRQDIADAQAKAANDEYSKGGRETRRVADWLTATPAPDPKTVCDVSLLPEQKRLVLTFMGLRDPVHRDQYFQAARIFAYDHGFPYLTLKKALDSAVQ